MSYCEKCGSPVNSDAKFCSSCGAPRKTPQYNAPPPPPPPPPTKSRLSYYSPPTETASFSPAPPPAAPSFAQTQTQAPSISSPQPAYNVPQSGSESVVGVMLLRRMKSLGRYDTFTGVLTSQRFIFAQMTSQMITTAAQQSREQAKAEGKGFFGQWGDQLRATFNYSQKYMSMEPQAILAETMGNFAVENNTISEIKVHLKGDHQQNQRREFQIDIHSSMGKYEFRMDENSDFTDLLKRVYDGKVKMPFGYFGKSINIKF